MHVRFNIQWITEVLVAIAAMLTSTSANAQFSMEVRTLSSWAYYGNRGTAVVDVTGDGCADVIVVNHNGIVVRRSTCTAHGLGGNEVWVGQAYYGNVGTFFADVTGDGRADAIAVNTNTPLAVRTAALTGVTNAVASGVFNNQRSWNGGPFYGSVGTFFADVNADRKADAIAVNASSVTVLLSNGSSFGSPQMWSSGTAFSPGNIWFEDVTQDGAADLLYRTSSGLYVGWSLATNPFGASNSFNSSKRYTSYSPSGSIATAFGDLDGDGARDVLYVFGSGAPGGARVEVQLNQLNGASTSFTFATPKIWLASSFSGMRGTFLADVDGRGLPDIVAVGESSITARSGESDRMISIYNWNIHGGFDKCECWGCPSNEYEVGCNTGRGVFVLDQQLEQIASANADVVLLQEVSERGTFNNVWDPCPDLPARIIHRLGTIYPYRYYQPVTFDVTFACKVVGGSYGDMVLSKYPIVTQELLRGSGLGEGWYLQRAGAEVGIRRINFYNIHFDPGPYEPTDYENYRRLSQMEGEVTRREGFDEFSFIIGDFNMGPSLGYISDKRKKLHSHTVKNGLDHFVGGRHGSIQNRGFQLGSAADWPDNGLSDHGGASISFNLGRTPTGVPLHIGNNDGLNGGNITGWAIGTQASHISSLVDLYFDGPPGVGERYRVVADVARPDVNLVTGYSGNRGYSFPVPTKYRNGVHHTVHAYGVYPRSTNATNANDYGSVNGTLLGSRTFATF